MFFLTAKPKIVIIPLKELKLMNTRLFLSIPLIITLVIAFSGCKKQTEEFKTAALTDYMPLEPGKSITYRLDSTVFVNFGRVTAVHKYQVKHVVDQQITDNEGRPAWRVFRYIRDSVDATSWTDAQPWAPLGSYMVTVLPYQLEATDDNNLRFIKLHLPITLGFNWKGNIYLPDNPYESLNPLNSYDNNMNDWDYTYQETDGVLSFNGKTYTDILTVEQVDEKENYPNTDPSSYASQNRSVEKYAKDIGLVYREYFLWEQQPNPILVSAGPPPVYNYDPFRIGFGITMWIIDHN